MGYRYLLRFCLVYIAVACHMHEHLAQEQHIRSSSTARTMRMVPEMMSRKLSSADVAMEREPDFTVANICVRSAQ
eukprot:scaffold1637_cov410-Prasinococcus_capsulatus_cf.AAC.19